MLATAHQACRLISAPGALVVTVPHPRGGIRLLSQQRIGCLGALFLCDDVSQKRDERASGINGINVNAAFTSPAIK